MGTKPAPASHTDPTNPSNDLTQSTFPGTQSAYEHKADRTSNVPSPNQVALTPCSPSSSLLGSMVDLNLQLKESFPGGVFDDKFELGDSCPNPTLAAGVALPADDMFQLTPSTVRPNYGQGSYKHGRRIGPPTRIDPRDLAPMETILSSGAVPCDDMPSWQEDSQNTTASGVSMLHASRSGSVDRSRTSGDFDDFGLRTPPGENADQLAQQAFPEPTRQSSIDSQLDSHLRPVPLGESGVWYRQKTPPKRLKKAVHNKTARSKNYRYGDSQQSTTCCC